MKCYPTEMAKDLEAFARMAATSRPTDYEYLKEKAKQIVEKLSDSK